MEQELNNNQIEENTDEDNTEESFEDLLNQSSIKPQFLNPGEKIEAMIIKISKDWVFIDSGGKSEGYIARDEFKDKDGNLTVKEGDRIKAYFLSSRNNERLFTTRLTVDSTGKQFLEEAYYNKMPVEGIVEKEIKGGYQVKIAGNVRAFCPYSQISLRKEEDGDKYIGMPLTFKLTEYGEKGRNIIVSHRIILQEEREKQKEILKQTLKEGMTISGEITSIKKFGAFVDVGGIEGLIPISEISWQRVEDIHSSVSIGQKVDVVIKKMDWENEKFSFSLREILPDPWEEIDRKYPEGSVHEGRVVRITKFGAFVNLEPGIDGLVHISELGKGKRINHPREVLEDNQTLKVSVNKVDRDQKRLSLNLISDDPEMEEKMDYKKVISGKGFTSGSFNNLGDLLKQKLKEQ